MSTGNFPERVPLVIRREKPAEQINSDGAQRLRLWSPACAEHTFGGFAGMRTSLGLESGAIVTVTRRIELGHHRKTVARVMLIHFDVVHITVI